MKMKFKKRIRIKKRATTEELQAASAFLDNFRRGAFEEAEEKLSLLGLAVMDEFVFRILERTENL